MNCIKKNLRLYIKFVAVILKSTMQYKLSFALMLLGRFILAFNGFIAIFFLFSDSVEMNGYTYGDILLCFSIVQMSFSIAECLGSGFKVFSGIVKRGEFDRMLLRPCNLILQVIGTKFEVGRLGPMITAFITLWIGVSKCGVTWGYLKWFTLILMVIGGTFLFIGLFMIGASICFFSIADGGIINVLTYGAKEHGKYPVDIYGKGLMKFCTYIIPYALIQYYPLQFLLGRTDRWQYALCPLAITVFLIICYAVWTYGIKNYKSCGN